MVIEMTKPILFFAIIAFSSDEMLTITLKHKISYLKCIGMIKYIWYIQIITHTFCVESFLKVVEIVSLKNNDAHKQPD